MTDPSQTTLLSYLFSNPLLSTLITIYVLVLLYFPSLFLQFISSSPVIVSTVVLSLNLLRLAEAQNIPTSSPGDDEPTPELTDTVSCAYEVHGNSIRSESFVEWDVRAPLEVVYEEYDEEDLEEEDEGYSISEEKRREADMDIIRRYASLSLFYPETDSDDSSEGDFPATGKWDSPEDMGFRWEDEDDGDRDGLIEIALDERKKSSGGFEVDEDNLIEIDLFPARPKTLVEKRTKEPKS